ncbi:translation initiation factor IF-2-like isoform X1 [Canis lupus familiaris]|uniref:translation initiation factor IF-2-like isoform X1 n=1 Tax=Canis lupus familiaris TaxID=9615 RepID=UPI0018F6CFDA|nr:translation initiation factor IF-2-like isoform X1 [Canis lupus familiaris]
MPLPGAGRGWGSGRRTAAVLGGGWGCNVTYLRVRCVCPRLGLPLAYIFPVPPRAQGRRRRTGDCSTVPEAGREPAELGEEPPRPRAEHAAPACSARVHPAQRGGDRAEAVAPGRCLGPDPLHVSPARSHVHRLSPVRRPDVLRINKMKLRATGGQIAPGPPNPSPRQNDPPHHCCLPPQPLRAAGARGASCSPGAPPPARAPSPARGRFAAVINKEGRQAHPSKSCCCMRPSQPPRNVLFKTGLTNMRNLSPLCCASPPSAPWLPRTGSQQEREGASEQERERASESEGARSAGRSVAKTQNNAVEMRRAHRWGLDLTFLRGALPRGAALDYAPRRGPAREGCSRNPELLGPARAGGGRASIRGRGEGGCRARGVPGPAPLLGTVSPLDLSPCR